MRIIILLILLLTLFWSYTSWYWYTCSIKGFCNNDEIKKEDNKSKNQLGLLEDDYKIKKLEKEVNNKISTGVLIEEDILSIKNDEIEKPESIQNEIENIKVEECRDILTKPILLGSENNIIDEVKNLEQFLNDYEGENLKINGIYEKDDLEAIKKLQLKYHEDILDPWDIKNPTGYVYKTTIKKINTLYCLNK